MTYNPHWANGDASGRVQPATHWVRRSDAQELADSVNRRHLLTYQAARDLSAYTAAGARVRRGLPAGDGAYYAGLRSSLESYILSPVAGGLGGYPASPAAMHWLDPSGGSVLVHGTPGAGEVSFFARLNGGTGWTDPSLAAGATSVRAVHFNELRAAVELLRRGRWEMPIYFSAGLISLLPDTTWVGGALANNGTQELRALGFAYLRHPSFADQGLHNVTVLGSSSMDIVTNRACSLAVYRCSKRVDFDVNLPTWNANLPGVEQWSAPGGLGDATAIGSAGTVSDGQGNFRASIAGGGLAAALQAMADGAEQNFLVRRTDSADPYTATLAGSLSIEFDLNTPPN